MLRNSNMSPGLHRGGRRTGDKRFWISPNHRKHNAGRLWIGL
jgi:hypothetical protein